jgi:ubiquinone/menaquinone biosynthesis C-methylase UbiE
MNATGLPPQVEMMKFILGKWISKPIYVVAKLRIADILSDGPKSIEELAQMINVNASSLYRVMRALACLGIFSETNDGRFELTPMAECLKSDALRPISLMMHSDWHDRAWDNLLESVKTGEKAFDKVHGMPIFDWFRENPQAAQIYNEANAIKAITSHRAIIGAYDFSGISSLTDIGGGNGSLIVEILKANSSLRGVVADLPSVVMTAKDFIHNQGFESRCKVIECDIFDKIPAGSDAYLMSHILHDWDDEECLTILRNFYKAMKPGTRLLVVEALIPAGNEFSIAKLLDIEVFVMGGGRERTENEFRDLFESTGLKLSKIVSTDESVSIIEGIRTT